MGDIMTLFLYLCVNWMARAVSAFRMKKLTDNNYAIIIAPDHTAEQLLGAAAMVDTQLVGWQILRDAVPGGNGIILIERGAVGIEVIPRTLAGKSEGMPRKISIIAAAARHRWAEGILMPASTPEAEGLLIDADGDRVLTREQSGETDLLQHIEL